MPINPDLSKRKMYCTLLAVSSLSEEPNPSALYNQLHIRIIHSFVDDLREVASNH